MLVSFCRQWRVAGSVLPFSLTRPKKGYKSANLTGNAGGEEGLGDKGERVFGDEGVSLYVDDGLLFSDLRGHVLEPLIEVFKVKFLHII